MKLFIKDQLPLICLYLLTFVGLFSLYNWLDGFDHFQIYFVFLSLVLLLGFLAYRYLTQRNIYNQLSSEPDNIEDMVLQNFHSALEEAYAKRNLQALQLYYKDINALKNTQENYQMMINHWVHELKTPVSVISMLAQINESDENFSKVKKEVNRINYNLSQIITYLRTEEFSKDLKIEHVSLKELTKEVINELKDFFITNSVFPSVSVDKDIWIHTDKKWLKIALYQIINNAIKYSDKDQKVYIGLEKNEAHISISITNYGVGILKSDIKRVFDLFYTGENGKHNGESSGMGLYIAKTALDMLNCECKVTSTANGKTTFTIFLKP
ncbi:sensor histidine kinase [Priestia megaterium]|uniref:sensor histidine kinase n=1 Tax=Priestia megaterium TaxID=1404 RepID=UPI003D0942C0